MKRLLAMIMGTVMIFGIAACGTNGNEITEEGTPQAEATAGAESETPASEIQIAEDTEDQDTETNGGKTLVVYFSQPETTDADDMTEDEDNSVVVIDGEVLGNTQYMAQVIQETTGGDIFRIEPSAPYPTDHDPLVDLASQEQEENARPEIKDQIENLDQYDTIYVGYPIWWGDMPMILYTFFDEYDFSGKTLIPFNTHGGSGFAGTQESIAGIEPEAQMEEGLTISRDDIQDAQGEIVDWVNELQQ